MIILKCLILKIQEDLQEIELKLSRAVLTKANQTVLIDWNQVSSRLVNFLIKICFRGYGDCWACPSSAKSTWMTSEQVKL